MENALEIILGRRGLIGFNRHLIRAIFLNNILQDPRNHHVPRPVFNFQDIDPIIVKEHFRFQKEDLPRLCQLLVIPDVIITPSRHRATGIEALCMLLRRLAYPNRLCDLELVFGRSQAALSEIIATINNHICQRFRHLLEDLNALPWLNEQRMQLYADAIFNHGAAVPNCFGFIDGTIRAICRPSEQQENYYSGHKKTHCVKYQSVVGPDGMTLSLLGAYQGRRHDAGILRESGLYHQIEQKARFPNGNFVLFGDQAYGVRELLLCPYPGRGINAAQEYFNASMSSVRQAVEWSFGKVIAEFAFLDYKKNQKLLVQDIEAMYKTGTILTNCHSCLYGNQSCTYFGLQPIDLEQYLN